MTPPFRCADAVALAGCAVGLFGPIAVAQSTGQHQTTRPAVNLFEQPSHVAATTPLTILRADRETWAEFNRNGTVRRIASVGGDAWVVRWAHDAGPAQNRDGIAAAPIDAHTLVDRAAHAALEAGLQHATGPARDYWIIPADRARPARRGLKARILAHGGSASLVESDGLLMRATLSPRALADLALSGEILWAEPWGAPDTDGSFVREFGGANAIETVEGFLGTGVIVEVVDKGLFQDHNDLVASDPYLRTLNDGPTDHGTATYGIIFGNGLTEAEARGMMPGQPGLFSSYLEIDDRDAHLCSFVNDYGGVIQSNSWGSPVNRRYTAPSAAMDDTILRHDVLIFQSQSNRGNPDSRPEAWAKNALSVGGINGHGTLDRSDDNWGGDASTGPAIDGRVKPDLVLFNDGIFTTSDEAPASHAFFTGTSAATPAAAGHAGIMVEMWRNGMFHGGDPLAVPSDRPSVAMSRAIMINSAAPYPFEHTADDMGRFRQGWGTPDLLNMWARAPRTAVHDETQPLAEDDAWVRAFLVDAGEPRLGVSLAWTDPAALPFADRTTINDLDLRVISPSGVVYLGNGGLHDGVYSTPRAQADSPDRTNTIENVFVAQPEPGIWQVEVAAHRVEVGTGPEAGQGTPSTRFALFATGVNPSAGTRAIRVVGDVPTRFPVRTERTFEFETHGFTPRGDGEIRFAWNGTVGGYPLTQVGPNRFRVDISGFECGADYEYRVTIPDQYGFPVSFPLDAAAPRPTAVGVNAVRTDANQSVNWSTDADASVTSGAWERGTPVGGGLRWDPPFDADGDGACWLTDNRAGSTGVNGGAVTLTSAPIAIDPDTESPKVIYSLWLASDAAGTPEEDTMLVEVSYDFGQHWHILATERSSFRWEHREHAIEPRNEELLMVRFTVQNGGDGSHVEAGIDALALIGETCPPCPGDVDGDGTFDLSDITDFLYGYANRSSAADMNQDGMIDLDDIVLFINSYQSRCP